ncbi:VUT family protein, partial [Candidatus Parcubacteria bacterium]|nr:VUT family protein [Candidatus Parcubacteria bacterium]
EFANSYILSKMKFKHAGLRGFKQGWRFVASTIVGEGLDTFIVMIIGFYGAIPLSSLFTTMVTLYVVKVLYEIIALPFSTRFANWVKRVEGVDVIDMPETTKYNPFTGITS